jgi:molecular chaperone DnaJ
MAEDLYSTLGVPKTASPEEIKKAYRRLARKCHPDVNQGDKAAEDRFKKVSGAFEVLSDPQKRKLYDEFGDEAAKLGWDEKKAEAYRAYRSRGGSGAGAGSMPYGEGVDLGDLFGDLFGRRRGAGAGGGMPFDFGLQEDDAGAGRGEDLTARVQLTLNEAVTGAERVLTVRRPGRCDACAGQGTVGAPTVCATCGGSGRTRQAMGPLSMARPCPTCHGTGRSAPPCRKCGGAGRVEETRTLTATIPAGVQTGSKVRLSGQGAAGRRGGPPGDLYIEPEVLPHPVVRREGDDLYLDLPLTVPEALGGAEVRVPTFTGEVTVTIPPGSQSGKKMRLRGKGAPRLKGGGRGDLYLTLKVMVPEHTNGELKEALAALERAYRRDVRAELKL